MKWKGREKLLAGEAVDAFATGVGCARDRRGMAGERTGDDTTADVSGVISERPAGVWVGAVAAAAAAGVEPRAGAGAGGSGSGGEVRDRLPPAGRQTSMHVPPPPPSQF